MTDDSAEATGLLRIQHFECDGPVEIEIEVGAGSVAVRLTDDAADDQDGPAVVDAEPVVEAVVDPVVDVTPTESPRDGTDEPDGPDRVDAPADATDGDRAEDLNANDPGDAGTAGAGDPADRTTAPAARTITVEVRAAPRVVDSWGLTGLLNWVNGQFGQPPFGQGRTDVAQQAVRETEVSVQGNRLVVRAPRQLPLRSVPLLVTVQAPAGSAVAAGAGSADVRVDGTAGRVRVDTGSGDVRVERAVDETAVKTGSGDVHLGPMADGLTARSGSGDLEITSLTGNGSLSTGSGDIWLGAVLGHMDDKVTVRTGSGDLTVADATAGTLHLTSGSGDLRVGIRSGVTAEVDVSCGSGRARSDLPVSDTPPSGAEPTLRVRARTGSGEAVIGPATA
ncbi:MAG TPA: DUF4097 family beta strand repeat-containing protein [Pseudonocardiaceae bacterium]